MYTPSSLGHTESGDVVLVHPELGDWVFEASGVGEMPGVMDEHRTVATVGSTISTMFPFRLVFVSVTALVGGRLVGVLTVVCLLLLLSAGNS